MNLGGAKAVAFDVIFSEPSIYRNARQDEIIDNAVSYLESAEAADSAAVTERRRSSDGQPRVSRQTSRFVINALQSLSAREDDASFARATGDYGKTVQAVFFSSQTGSARSWPAGVEKPLFQPENFGPFLNRFDISAENETGAQFPIRELTDTAAALGCVTGSPDSDGIIRRIKPFTMFDGKTVPGLSAALLMVGGAGKTISFDEKNNTLKWEDYTIPVDKNGNALLRFKGELERYIPYKASDIIKSALDLENGKEPLLPPENFAGSFVFFGLYAPGLFDIFSTPISSLYPGMGCHITMLDNILQGDFIRESSLPVNMAILFIVVTAVIILTLFSHRISLSVGGIVLLTAVIVAVSFGMYQSGLWLPMITYIAGILASFITATLFNYATEGSQKRFIKSAFSQYLSPKVIERIIQDPSQLKLGGEKREMTAIFTDVRAFSTISEALGDPAKLVELLNFYLTRMSNIVLDNQGTIDKYEGDAIIAFFGAPVHMDNHASLACRAAVMMKKAEAIVNSDTLGNGLITQKVREALAGKGATKSADDPFPLFTRIGVNTGDMVVGNMGTPNKMDYTIMGNAVNLAARLEGVNKQYDTGGILISEYTRQHIGDEFIIRPLSRVRVVGINTPLRLYELLDIASEAQAETLNMVKDWGTAFELYEKRDFSEAKNIFQAIFDKNGSDMAAKKYLDRCAKYISSPPDEKIWDNGVDNLTEK
jgi:class 3 adenylate cyclase/CHASE2 domain-containing sensor protein